LHLLPQNQKQWLFRQRVFEGKLKFRKKVTVKFGKPIQPEEIAVSEEINPKELRAVKQRIMGDIQNLLEEKNGN